MSDNNQRINHLIKNSSNYLDEFKALTSDIPYERKGILFSEMFFFWLFTHERKPHRILESGRARGQSTLILSHCFPNAEIISVERDQQSPDVTIAANRLHNCANVRQLFGDATHLLPNLTQPGDIALIDGPKGYRGLRLALRLLGEGKTPLVFLHDASKGSIERRFLSQHLPETQYSDNSIFSEKAHLLDHGVWEELPQKHRWTANEAPIDGYGFSLACLPYNSNRSYQWLRIQAIIDGFIYRLSKRK